MNKIELLAPAGDMERAIYAFEYGADAIYLGAKQYSLRARSSNFEFSDIKKIVDLAHQKQKKVYLVTNVICHNYLIKGFEEFMQNVSKFGIDGYICADPFIIDTIKQKFRECEIHISTQQSVTNSKAALFFKKHANATRVVLARELKLEEIQMTSQNLNNLIEVEVFIHGAVCISYSGRCMMSNNFSLRDANIGGCAQSCRWEYDIEGLKNFNHSFTMSAKDMSYINYITKLMSFNIQSFKIEGRMKTVNYLTTIIKNYKAIMEAVENNNEIDTRQILCNLNEVANRPTDDAMLINADENKMLYHDEQRKLAQTFIFSITKKISDYEYEILSKNYFSINQNIYVSQPFKLKDEKIIINEIFNLNLNESVEVVNTPLTRAIIKLKYPISLSLYSIGRVKDE